MRFRPLQSIAKRFARRKSFPAIARYCGAAFVLDPRNWIDNRIVAGVPYEPGQIARTLETVRSERLDILVDVGANFGLYAAILGRESEIADVVAIEPMRRNYNQLLANVFANRLDGKVRAFCTALADEPGTGTLHIDPRSTGTSRLSLENCGRDPEVFTEREPIRISRLDDLCQFEGRRIFVKVDVEGSAEKALAGAKRLFERNVVFAQVEVVEDEGPAVEAFMNAHGLEAVGAIESDTFFAPRHR